jgi:hypothetical protein
MASPPPQAESPLRLPGRRLRQATLVLPRTGERVKRDFTLRDPRLHPGFYQQYNSTNSTTSATTSNESTPLLPTKATRTAPESARTKCIKENLDKTKELTKKIWQDSVIFWTSPIGQNVFKASFAYFLGTLCVFSTPVATRLGTNRDANQLVANVVVWFDPARSAGSMELAWFLGLCGFLYGTIVAFSSMGLTVWLASMDQLVLAHVIVVVVFFGGSLGSIAWFKQHYNHPLANTASGVASLAIVGVLTKEGAVQTGLFSHNRIVQNLKMLAIGIFISTVVNLVVFPVSAAREMREGLTKTTTAFADLLAKITGSFLSGLEEDFDHPIVNEALEHFNSVFHTLPAHLAEARYEHFLLGTEREWRAESRLIECLQKIAQDMGGLRSSASTQFALMKNKQVRRQPGSGASTPFGPLRTRRSSIGSINTTIRGRDDLATRMLESIEEVSESSSNDGDRSQRRAPERASARYARDVSATAPPGTDNGEAAELFDIFMDQLGPPMVRLRIQCMPNSADEDRNH